MKWISFAGDARARLRPFAGLYLRTPKRTRFWGWGNPRVTITVSPAEKHEEDVQPWAGLADWLRAAHSLFGSADCAQATVPGIRDQDFRRFAPSQAASASQTEDDRQRPGKKRRLRFVCSRRAIGLFFD
jgi:hypothetical protein